MGAADSLLNETKFPTIQKALSQEIITASLRLNRLIENLLNMSRLESGHLSVRLDWHDLNDLFNKVTDDLKEELKPFDLDIIIPENFPLVRIDFGLMEQVLYNILHNATQYTNPETLIKLLADYTDGILTITIKDHGIGFPEERLPYVFEKFFKASHNQTGGLGLGLSIAKGFVQAHGGQIMVENNENGGASFIIKLPTELPGFISI
jgi:two-component system sensor histidine kinase KdpD